MEKFPFFDSAWFIWVVLPILIAFARVVDVSLGTLRMLFIARGYRKLAPILGFFEVFIWLLAISQIMRNLTNIICYLAYASGFALGTYIGMYIENRLAIGSLLIRVITHKDANELIQVLKDKNYGITSVDAQGSIGQVKIIFTLISRRKLSEVVNIVKHYNPNAFYTVEDIRFVRENLPNRIITKTHWWPSLNLRFWRLGK